LEPTKLGDFSFFPVYEAIGYFVSFSSHKFTENPLADKTGAFLIDTFAT